MRFFYFILVSFIAVLVFVGCKDNSTTYMEDSAHSPGSISGIVVQKNSQAKVSVNQEKPVAITNIDPEDGSFRLDDLAVGNYDIAIEADNFRVYKQANVNVQSGGTTYLGEINLSTIPDLVANHYPVDNGEVVYDNRFYRLTISISFTRPMDRESVENAFSTNPPIEGTFYWGSYTTQPRYSYYYDNAMSGFDPGATITTYSKIGSFIYSIAQKDSYVDTTYHVTLATTAKDTSGTSLRFPLDFSFSTVQTASTINTIQTYPYNGDVDVALISYSGLQITFPRNMDHPSTEAAISMTPASDPIFIWPALNQLTIYTGGVYKAESNYKITVGADARDLDNIPLGSPFSFSFTTAAVQISSTSPQNGQLFVDTGSKITLWFNTYMSKTSVENAFSITPAISGHFIWGTGTSNDSQAISFIPTQTLQYNTKYTVKLNTAALDLMGTHLKDAYTFSFITRPE